MFKKILITGLLFLNISVIQAESFTLTGATEQSSIIFINKNTFSGVSFFCNFTTVTDATMKVFLGNKASEVAEASTLTNITGTGISGLEQATFSKYFQLRIEPITGSFTAICETSNN